jgi:3-deoxy-D-manno-octulosonic-acid transferase
MYLVYSLLLGLGFLILLPRFAIDALRHGKYVEGFWERLGSIKPVKSNGRPLIWVHCVSVGETQAARPLIKQIKAQYPNHEIVVSTITATGQSLAQEFFKKDVERVFYFPFDWGWTTRRSLNALNPTAVLLMETEIWPGFLRQCKRQSVPVAIVNGRLSDQSFRRYRLIKGFMKRVLAFVDVAIMQTEADAERLTALGMDRERTFVAGNLKFDAGALTTVKPAINKLSGRFSFAEGPVILAASTHSPEERILLETFRLVLEKASPPPRLVIAPRHPERFAEVARLIESSGFRWARRSNTAADSDHQAEVILVDSIGELQSLYSLATIVFVGGSISRAGGHNILEPAAFAACVVTGPHTHNFRLIVHTFVDAKAVVQLPNIGETKITAELAAVFINLLDDEQLRTKLGRRARALVQQYLGATDRTLELLKPMLAGAASSASAPQLGLENAGSI